MVLNVGPGPRLTYGTGRVAASTTKTTSSRQDRPSVSVERLTFFLGARAPVSTGGSGSSAGSPGGAGTRGSALLVSGAVTRVCARLETTRRRRGPAYSSAAAAVAAAPGTLA